LIPKQYSTGGKAKLLGISKRGNRYLRTMFIHGARSLVLRVNRERSTGGRLDQQPGGQGTPQRGDRSHGSQAGADYMGGAIKRRAISPGLNGSVSTAGKSFSTKSAKENNGRKNSQATFLRTWVVKCFPQDRRIRQDRDVRISSSARRLILQKGRIHLRRLNFVPKFLLAGARRTTHSQHLEFSS
jgi:hypothetical protein